ncbi:MAG: hypothetical protein CMJ06_04340 [Pelagibacterales bacterium]|nr:hypothetical protein [Pelagibacterales bacterium]OUU61941.1 MAG: hypothetical protein CBC22_05790 [Alphaproteobacteria bacterium TMED62]|tara:strand:+ start:13848 stop:14273 length:426 start_codon:yes stop_codon:yes gene_type:complete
MFLKNSNLFSDSRKNTTLSIIAEGIDFSGEINTEGNIHIDGTMRGTIRANEVVVGPNGEFDGEIVADVLIINGTIKGKFTIKNLYVKKDGLIQGRAKYEILVVETGGKIQGELGINKQNKLISKKNGKEKVNSKNGSMGNF